MAANLKLVEPASRSAEKLEDMLIHVRFAPNGKITAIDAAPAGTTADAWFERLCAEFSQHYQTLAGGRGFFRIPRAKFDQLGVQ